MAAKIFEWRRPWRTKIESMAQPMAEQMAIISANSGVNFGLYPSEQSDKPRARRFANAETPPYRRFKRGLFGVHSELTPPAKRWFIESSAKSIEIANGV